MESFVVVMLGLGPKRLHMRTTHGDLVKLINLNFIK